MPVLVQPTGADSFWLWEAPRLKTEFVDRHRGSPVPVIDPPHPVQMIRRERIEPLMPAFSRAAEGLGLSRQTLPVQVNEQSGASVEMARCLSRGFGSSPETWLGWQTAHECSKARPK
jgi:addiction module HigA family antidote